MSKLMPRMHHLSTVKMSSKKIMNFWKNNKKSLKIFLTSLSSPLANIFKFNSKKNTMLMLKCFSWSSPLSKTLLSSSKPLPKSTPSYPSLKRNNSCSSLSWSLLIDHKIYPLWVLYSLNLWKVLSLFYCCWAKFIQRTREWLSGWKRFLCTRGRMCVWWQRDFLLYMKRWINM